MSSDPLTTVASYLHRDEAELARAQLDASGIPAMVQADDEGGLSPGFFSDFRIRLVASRHHLGDALEVLGAEAVVMDHRVAQAIVRHAEEAAPLEACGLVAVDDTGRLTTVHSTENKVASPVRFVIDPVEIHDAMRSAESAGERIGAVYHSHPTRPATPSPVDIAHAPDPDWLCVIVGPGSDPEIRAYRIAGGDVDEVALYVE